MRPSVLIFAVAGYTLLATGPVMAKGDVYLSLMGEPYWTNEAGVQPFDQWLEMADLDKDGAVSRAEFRGDADAFFESLDKNGDKVIDGDEMAQYERLAPGKTRADGGGAVRPSSARPKPKSSSPTRENEVAIVTTANVPSATRIHPGGGPIDYSTVPQPVAMADRNLDRRVTIAEFRKTADLRFGNYDTDKDGRLSRKELR